MAFYYHYQKKNVPDCDVAPFCVPLHYNWSLPPLDFYLKTTLAWFEFSEVAGVKDGVPYQKGSFLHVKKRKILEESKVESCSEKGQGSDSDVFDLIAIEEGENI
jgi:hypothetical protein